MEISLTAEKLIEIGNLQITNSLLTTFIVVFVVSLFAVLIGFTFKTYKPSKLQVAIEMIVSGLESMVIGVIGEKGKRVFPFLMTLFVFIVVSNWFGLLPIVGTIGLVEKEHIEGNQEIESANLLDCLKTKECVFTLNFKVEDGVKLIPLFRAPTSDLSATIALALISVVMTNVIAVASHGIGYFKKYVNLTGFIEFSVGLLELVSEIGKVLSFTFRLFGNVFAGEVLLIVITSISFGLATLPFLGLEAFVGFIQGFVFFMLTTVFIGVALSEH